MSREIWLRLQLVAIGEGNLQNHTSYICIRSPSPRFLCRPTTLYIIARAVERQSAIYTENSWFAYSNLYYLLLLALLCNSKSVILDYIYIYVLYVLCSVQFWSAWSVSRASWVLFRTPRPPSPTIHYTLPRFILKDPGLQPLRNPQKQVAILDVMTNPKITLGLTRGG
jgi:hypothetical protein